MSSSSQPIPTPMSKFEKELQALINRYCLENGSNTPDFMLAEYLSDCLAVFNKTVNLREQWYGRKLTMLDNMPAPPVSS